MTMIQDAIGLWAVGLTSLVLVRIINWQCGKSPLGHLPPFENYWKWEILVIRGMGYLCLTGAIVQMIRAIFDRKP